MKQKMKMILDHPMVKIIQTETEYKLFIKMKDGKYALQAPYPGDQRGIIGAMMLATDVLAGKVLLHGVVELDGDKFQEPEILSIQDTRVLPDKR